jgi:hypothetical protein
MTKNATYSPNENASNLIRYLLRISFFALKNANKTTFLFVFAFFMVKKNHLQAQNVQEVAKAKPFVMNGFINTSGSIYKGTRSDVPRSWAINASANATLFGVVSLPFSVQISDRQLAYNSPTFRRFGLSPTYKKLTLHGGYRNMSFSPYTMNAYTFLGGGLEYKGKWMRLSGMYGKLEQDWYAPTETVVAVDKVPKFYDRIAFGAKIAFGTEDAHIDFMGFKFKDKYNPLLYDSLSKVGILPVDNGVLGSELRFKVSKYAEVYGSAAVSGVTENQKGIPIPVGAGTDYDKIIKKVDKVITVNTSSRYSFAYHGGINLFLGSVTLGGKYERVDPFYRSLGLYNLPNDVENITANAGIVALKGKLMLNMIYGTQRNNLKSYQSASYKRRIGALNLTAVLAKNLTWSGNYANFTMNYQPKLVNVNDTLRFANENNTLSSNLNYTIRKGKKSQTISLFVAQNSFTEIGNGSNNFENQTRNGNLNYRWTDKTSGWSFRSGLTYNRFFQGKNTVQRQGLTLGANKDFGKKTQLGLTAAYSNNKTAEQKDGYIARIGGDLQYTPHPKHTFSIGLNEQIRKTKILKPFNELQGNISYSFSF